MGFVDRLGAAWTDAAPVRELVLVPFVHALLQVRNLERVTAFRGRHVGIAFPFPSPVLDVWGFVSLPNPSGGLTVSGSVVLLPLLVVVEAALVAGYLGGLETGTRTGEYDFLGSVREHFVPILGYVAAVTLAGFALVGAAVAGGPAVVLLALPALFVAGYLFYAAPFLVVLEGVGIVAAAGRSYGRAVEGGAHGRFFLGHLGVGALVSLPATAVVVNLGLAGAVLGAALLAPVGFAFTAATLGFLRESGGGGPSETGGGTAGAAVGSDDRPEDDGHPDAGGTGGA